MEYGVIYLKLIPKEGNLSWIKYCHIYGALPFPIQEGIGKVVSTINNEYKGDIIVPMGLDAQLGCITTPDSVTKVAESLYGMYCVMLNSLDVAPDVRVVYSIGDIRNVNVGSIHQISHDEVMVKVGHYLDGADETGIFKI